MRAEQEAKALEAAFGGKLFDTAFLTKKVDFFEDLYWLNEGQGGLDRREQLLLLCPVR